MQPLIFANCKISVNADQHFMKEIFEFSFFDRPFEGYVKTLHVDQKITLEIKELD